MKNREYTGLTLPGLLVALAIIAILGGLSAPSWKPLIDRQRGVQLMRQLQSFINAARTAAIRENTRVTVCPAPPDRLSCNGAWSGSLIAFLDPRGRRQPAPEHMLRRLRWTGIEGSLRWRAFGNRQYLSINSRGQIPHQSGNFTWCPMDGRAELAQQLVINGIGRMRRASDRNGDGIREDSSGDPLSCS